LRLRALGPVHVAIGQLDQPENVCSGIGRHRNANGASDDHSHTAGDHRFGQ
jgi:hypothetical protein